MRPRAHTVLEPGHSSAAAIVALVLLAAIAGCAPRGPWRAWETTVAADHPLVGRVWDARTGAWLEPDAVAERVRGARIVVLGEKHDNADHHRLQAWLVDAAAHDDRRPTVALEMLDVAQAPAVAECLRTCADVGAELGSRVGWAESGWHDYAIYQPIVAAAARHDLPIVAANLPTRTVRRLVMEEPAAVLEPGSFPAQVLAEPLPDPIVRAIDAEITATHCGHAPGTMLPGMVRAQRARDAQMAATVLAAPAADGALLVAGTGHARRDWGVPAVLASAAPEVTVASVAFVEVQAGVDDPAAYLPASATGEPVWDLLWFTPRVDTDDPCARFREQLEKMGKPPH